jgi:hypothetical protein
VPEPTAYILPVDSTSKQQPVVFSCKVILQLAGAFSKQTVKL